MTTEPTAATSWPLTLRGADGRLRWHVSGTNPPEYAIDEKLEALYRQGQRMKPYYDRAGITIYHGDWRAIAAPAADLVLTDPPYGVSLRTATVSSGRNKLFIGKDFPAIEGDNEPFNPAPILELQTATILWGANHYADSLPPSPSWLIWDKREGTTPDDNADCEVAWSNLGGPIRMYSHLWRGGITKSERTRRVHPTQKPVALMRWCLQRAKLKPGALVFDPYMGSGPIAQACKELGFRYVGCELVEHYCEIAANRLSQEVMNMEAA